MHFDRRSFLRAVSAASLGAPLLSTLFAGPARAQSGRARRLLIFYFPDGVAGPSQDGQPSPWHATGAERNFTLTSQLEPLLRHQSSCVFFNGLSMGPADSGSHPGGAKKLLTGVDGGNGESIDHLLARTVGATAPHRHVYLGAMANHNNASGDKHISYPSAGQSVAPEDDPLRAFDRLFGAGHTPTTASRNVGASVIDGMLAETHALKAMLGAVEAQKLDFHLESLREVERRIKNATPSGTCEDPSRPTSFANLYDPGRFPEILRLQSDLLVQAMACGLTKVGVIQASHHTSELIMSRFPGSEMFDPAFDMRSHQASHYGARHDPSHREFADYVKQRRWFVGEFAHVLDQLANTPEDGSTMLEHSIVLLASEVCDGNTHLHDNMPFVLAGSANGLIETGRLIDAGNQRHAGLLTSIAHAMGEMIPSFGDTSSGPLYGLLR